MNAPQPRPRDPLFLRFINRETGVSELISIFSRSNDPYTRETCEKALENPPDIEEFHKEITDAVNDIISAGAGEEFKAFVNNYMQDSIVEDVITSPTSLGDNVSRTARILDASAPWVQGLLCYNLCLYLKVYGTENLKRCRICGKIFVHKGKYAVYCSDQCKEQGKRISKATEHGVTKPKKVIKEKEENPGLNLSGLLS